VISHVIIFMSLSRVSMWKGYRDAQCGWLAGPLLVLYAPRRGLLEVWEVGE